MRILRLAAENVKRLTAVEITPDGAPLVVVGGHNGAGKSSVLDAIEMALGGADSIPDKPVHTGQHKAKVVVDLGDIVVTRTFTATGGTALVVENKEGARFRSPQAMLDKLFGTLSFDPLEFERMDDKPQRETLRRLVNLDTADIDKESERVYAERTEVNRSVKQMEGQLAGMHSYPEAPAEEVSIEGLTNELAAAEDLRRAHDAACSRHETVRQQLKMVMDNTAANLRGIERLEQQLVEARELLAQQQASIVTHEERLAAAATDRADRESLLVDVDPIRQRLASAEGVNRQVRANHVHKELQQALAHENGTAESLTARLQALERERQDRLEAVRFPVPGLGFSADGGITFNGEPFSQCSQGERLRVSVGMGLALNPACKVLLIREGSRLDAAGLRMLAQLATEAGAQLWIERVTETPEGSTVFIEDGHVKAPRETAALPF